MTVYVAADLLSAYRSMYQGMVEQDTDLLDDLLADTRVHHSAAVLGVRRVE